jgi:hypothetical protein
LNPYGVLGGGENFGVLMTRWDESCGAGLGSLGIDRLDHQGGAAKGGVRSDELIIHLEEPIFSPGREIRRGRF